MAFSIVYSLMVGMGHQGKLLVLDHRGEMSWIDWCSFLTKVHGGARWGTWLIAHDLRNNIVLRRLLCILMTQQRLNAQVVSQCWNPHTLSVLGGDCTSCTQRNQQWHNYQHTIMSFFLFLITLISYSLPCCSLPGILSLLFLFLSTFL